MDKIILSVFLILVLFPISSGFSEVTDNQSTLSVVLPNDSQSVYKDDEGYTVVVGVVENTSNLTSITNVRLHVYFYDNVSTEPLEIIDGGTILEVIPPLGKSPYMIRSNSSNPDITQASVSLSEGFHTSPSKLKQLSVKLSSIVLDDTLHFSGVLKNGAAPINNTNVYLAFYDNFIPPRIIGVSTIPIGAVESNEIINFSFNEKIQTSSVSLPVGFFLFSESNVFYSDIVDVKIPIPRLVTISHVSVLDSQGKAFSEIISVGSIVQIQSEARIQFLADPKSDETPYSYYVQIKQSGKTPFVEFIGKYNGRYIGTGNQFQSIDWIPEHDGLFFIETFVWDRNNIPIAEQGPVVLVVVK